MSDLLASFCWLGKFLQVNQKLQKKKKKKTAETCGQIEKCCLLKYEILNNLYFV